MTPKVSAIQPISGPPSAWPAENTMIHSETTRPRIVARDDSCTIASAETLNVTRMADAPMMPARKKTDAGARPHSAVRRP